MFTLKCRTSSLGCAMIALLAVSNFPGRTWGEDEPKPAAQPAAKSENQQGAAKTDSKEAGSKSEAADQRGANKSLRLVGVGALVRNESVLTELGIENGSAEHQAILDVFKNFAMDLQKRSRNPTDEDRAERLKLRDLYAKGEAELAEKVKKLLQPAQAARLQQILIQQWGIEAVNNAEIASDLQITKEQQDRFARVDREIEEVRRELEIERKTLRENGDSLDEVTNKIGELKVERERKYVAILTAAQLEKFENLKGKPFELKRPPPPRFAGSRQGMPIQVRTGSLMSFALRGPVYRELGIEKDSSVLTEINKLAVAHRNELSAGLRAGMEKSRGGETTDTFDPYEFGAKLQAKYYPELKKLLTQEQFARLQQIEWQRKGILALDDPDLSSALEVTAEQKEKLDSMTREIFKKTSLALMRTDGRTVGISIDDESQKKINELATERETKGIQILTTSQQEKFASMKGKPFDLELLRTRPDERVIE